MKSINVTGMVRSGTTLVSRALDAHEQVLCPPDPYMGFFRPLRNDLYKQAGYALADPEHPISDFFCTSGPSLKQLASMHLDLKVTQPEAFFRAELNRFSSRNVPSLVPGLNAIELDNYKGIFASLVTLLHESFSEENALLAGFKQTWVEPFWPVVCNSFPDVRVVHVLRDPRAVLASWRTTTNLSCAYPFLMILRHWRKSVAAALANSSMCPNYHVIRYEDFVTSPEDMAHSLCEILELPFDSGMLDVSRFRSGHKADWKTNTSYEQKSAGIRSDSVSAWKKKLDDEQRMLIEYLAEPEMRCAGYEPMSERYDDNLLTRAILPAMESREADDWADQLNHRYALSSENIERERTRRAIWDAQDADLDEVQATAYFIDPRLARHNLSRLPLV